MLQIRKIVICLKTCRPRYFSTKPSSQQTPDEELQEKLIKVAIIGVPNSGKSTLINSLMNQRVCPTSNKVHTTRTFAKAISTRNNSQIVLFDTPGLVGKSEMKKHKLDQTFISSCRHSIQHSKLIGVLHDVSNHWTRNSINPIILKLLEEYKTIPSFLILNKIDKLRSKRTLLDLVKSLSCNNLELKDTRKTIKSSAVEKEQDSTIPNEKYVDGWPHFINVFMVSSLTGDGIDRVMSFIESNAVAQKWEHTKDEHTDQKPEELIEQFVRARLLDYMPQEIPYLLNVQLEYFERKNNRILASVNIACPNDRIEKLLCGVSDGKLKQITERITSDLIETFQAPVTLTLSTISLKKKQ